MCDECDKCSKLERDSECVFAKSLASTPTGIQISNHKEHH